MYPVKYVVSLYIATGLAAFTVVGSSATSQQAVLAQDAALPQQRHLIAQRQSRIALVIGNAAYDEGSLANPVNDATDIAKTFEELGFEVILRQNLNKREMEEEIEAFSRKLRNGSVGIFYYAGHGIQVDGENYLIPIKAKLQNEKDARYDAVPLGKALNAMEASGNLWNFVIVDACRDNPFYRRWNRTIKMGLTASIPPNGTIIAYSTKAGSVAADGVGQRNSPFTSALLEKIKTPNLDIRLVLGEVTALVVKQTGMKQVPWTEGNLIGSNFYLNPKSDLSKIPIPLTPSQPLNTPIATQTSIPSPRIPESVSQPTTTTIVNFESFEGYAIDIFYFEGRKDLEPIALSVKSQLDKYPFDIVRVREFNPQQGQDIVICPYFEIRYDSNEINQARSIKYLLEKSLSNINFDLKETNKSSERLRTPNYISIFITDSNTLAKVYPESFENMNYYCNSSR